MLPLSRANDLTGYQQVRDEAAQPVIDRMADALDRVEEYEQTQAAGTVADGERSYSAARTTMVAVLVVGLGVALLLGVLVSRMIVTALRRVSHAVQGMGEGDLTRTIDVHTRCELR